MLANASCMMMMHKLIRRVQHPCIGRMYLYADKRCQRHYHHRSSSSDSRCICTTAIVNILRQSMFRLALIEDDVSVR